MKALFAAMIVTGLFCANACAEDWTIQGKTYHNVTVQNVTADHVEIMYDGGVGSPKLADLPPDLQKRFNYGVPQESDADVMIDKIRKEAGHVLVVKVGGTDIQLPEPPGLVELPANHPMVKVAKDLTPLNCTLLRSSISAVALGDFDDSTPIAFEQTLALTDATMDIDSGQFIDFVEDAARRSSHGVLESQDTPIDYVETQKRFDAFQKDTGVAVKEAGNLYSLGLMSRSDACVTYMTARDFNLTYKGKTERNECMSIIAYLRLRKKVVIAVTSMTKPLFFHDDLKTLKDAAERYQLSLQVLNNM